MARTEELCMGCMGLRKGVKCPACGWVEGTPQTSPVALPPRTVLDGRYLLGKVLGAGGFGITYLAWDLNLDIKLAIKEYFPSAFGSRDQAHSTVLPAGTQAQPAFEHGLAKFLEEGRALALFQGHPGIASVMTFFKANHTSYLVMKYEEGTTLDRYLNDHGGRLDFDQVLGIAMPVMDALRAVHQEGILHRDISPDNIIINSKRQIKILDFGSAKRDMTVRDVTLQVTLKRGFSPEEQYHASGRQGPWTDVYALAATLYQCLTGLKPPESLERRDQDNLQPPSQIGIRIPKNSEKALMKALAVRAPDRFQTMEEFQKSFQPRPQRRNWWKEILAASSAAMSAAMDWVRPRRRHLAWGGGSALVLLVIMRLSAMLFAAPVIREFAVEPRAVAPGQTATLHWSASGGRLSITPAIGPIQAAAGTRQVLPSGTTTYTLTARGVFRSVSRPATVVVGAAPPQPVAVNFTAEPPTIKKGGSAELVWSVSGKPKSVTIDQGIGTVSSEGRQKVSPTADTTYTLLAEGANGEHAQSAATVLMEAVVPKPQIVSLEVKPASIKRGQIAVLSWEVRGTGAVAVFDQNIGRVQERDSVNVSPSASTTYTLRARNAGGVVSRSVSVEVVKPEVPVIRSFTANPESVFTGRGATLSWSVSGEVGSVSIVPGFPSLPSEGSRTVTPSSTTNYVLTAAGPGGSVSSEANVRVVAANPPTIRTFRATPMLVGPKDPVLLQWMVIGNVESVTLDPGGVPLPPEGTLRVNPTAATRYVLRAAGPGGTRSSSVDVQVSTEAFRIILFEARPIRIRRGKTARISWAVSGPVTEVGLEPGIGKLSAATGSIDVTPDRDTTYTLTAQAGNKILTAKVKVAVR